MHDESTATEPEDLSPAESELDTLRRELAETRRLLDEAERRRRIDRLLTESEAIDLETARLLTEAAVVTMDDADVEKAVNELRRRCPYLFRAASGGSSVAMSAKPRRGAHRGADDAAEHAAATGDRRDLLRYLRLRRTRTA